jgi:hypothetical protein
MENSRPRAEPATPRTFIEAKRRAALRGQKTKFVYSFVYFGFRWEGSAVSPAHYDAEGFDAR